MMYLGERMLVVSGFFENERFVPDRLVSLPQRKRLTVTIEEEKESKEPSFKELAVQAKTMRAHIQAETGIIDVRSMIYSIQGLC
jgi:hypothetical protein